MLSVCKKLKTTDIMKTEKFYAEAIRSLENYC